MRKSPFYFLLAAGIIFAACSEDRYSTTIQFPCAWPGSPGFAGNIDRQNFVQPSGICFHPQRKTLFIVGDDGEIAEIKTDGTPVFNWKTPGDFEAITVDPKTGLMYIVIEGEDVILEFDPEKWEITRRFPVNREYQGNPRFLQKQTDRYDNGIESLAFVPDEGHPEGGAFYAGNQEDPSCIMEILVPLKSGRAKTAEAKILRVLPIRITDPAAMYYEAATKRLNVVSDADNILIEITLSGEIVREYAFPGDMQEGICTDPEGFIYIAQDSGGIFKLKDLRKK